MSTKNSVLTIRKDDTREGPFKRSWTNPYPGVLSYFFRSVAPGNNAQGQLMLEWLKYPDLRPYIKVHRDEIGTTASRKGDITKFEIKTKFIKSYQKRREVLKERNPSDFAHDSMVKKLSY